MTPESQALLDLTAPPTGVKTTPATDASYSAGAAMQDLLATVQQRVLDVRRAIRAANATEEDVLVYTYFEEYDQIAATAQRLAQAAAVDLDKLCDAMWQLDQHAASVVDRVAKGAPVPGIPRVSLSVEEHAHLLARADAGDAAVAELAKTTVVLAQPSPGVPVP